VNFSAETLQARRECDNLFKVLKEKNPCQLRMLYPEKLSIRNEGELRLPDKQKLMSLSSPSSALIRNARGVFKVIAKDMNE
jgi:hypothetical protein